MGQTGDRRAGTSVIAALQDPDALVRYFATLALQHITSPEVIEPLLTAVASESDPYNRLYMVLELLRRGESRGIEHVFTDIAAVADEGNHDFDDAPGIAAAIADLGEPALGHLIDALNHPNKTVRWIAGMALGEMRDTRAIELLKRAEDDVDPLVREEAAHVLEKRRGR